MSSLVHFLVFVSLVSQREVSSTWTDAKDSKLTPKPFRVVWNYPDQKCRQLHNGFHMPSLGVEENSNGQFVGGKIATLYSLGLWPRMKNNVVVNNGIPQLGNLTRHIDALKTQVRRKIPANSSGHGVIDMEDWRPFYTANWGVFRHYRTASLKLVEKTIPRLSKQQKELLAIKQFDNASRIFMEESIRAAKSVYPSTHWGYYGYPRYWGSQGASYNNMLSWLWRISTGLYPSIYLKSIKEKPYNESRRIVELILREAIRVREIYGHPHTPIMAYSLIQNGPTMFTKKELYLAIGLPAEMGIDGVVLWGSSSVFHPSHVTACVKLQTYARDVLGPYVTALTARLTTCSRLRCGGRGRCVRKDLAEGIKDYISKIQREYRYFTQVKSQTNRALHTHTTSQSKVTALERSATDVKASRPFFDNSTLEVTSTRPTFHFPNTDGESAAANRLQTGRHTPTLMRSPDTKSTASHSSQEGQDIADAVVPPKVLPSPTERKSSDHKKRLHRRGVYWNLDEEDSENLCDYVCQCYKGYRGPACEWETLERSSLG